MYKNIRNIFSTSVKKKWLMFIIRAIILFFLFLIFYKLIRKIPFIDNLYVYILNKFATFLLHSSTFFVHLLGYEVVYYGKTIKIIDNLYTPGVYLDRGCMGRNVMLAYAGLIAVFPGKFIHKLWYIPMGLIIITFINIIRISGLAVIYYRWPEYGDINHYVIFKYTAWLIILILWIIWMNKFSTLSLNTKPKNDINS